MPLPTSSHRKKWANAVHAVTLSSVIGLSAAATLCFGQDGRCPDAPEPINAISVQDAAAPIASAYRYERLANPARTVVRNSAGVVVATLTDGARTVVLAGPTRTFQEPRMAPAVITSNAWVRLIAREWLEGGEREAWFRPWLDSALGDRTPDALAVAMEYLDGAPPGTNDQNVRFRGDASFAQVKREGRKRPVASDFYDYLGMPWTFPDGVRRKPGSDRYGTVDCSGFLRLVYGYRLGYPLRGSNTPGLGLPRSARAMSEWGPGVSVVAAGAGRAPEYSLLQPGDLVFFDLGSNGSPRIDCVGMYFGMDSGGHHRFISSRPVADGPTFGSLGGASLLDGGGRFSQGFRSAKRI